MAYLVNFSARAQRDLAQIYKRIDADDSDAALKNGIADSGKRFSVWRNNPTDAP